MEAFIGTICVFGFNFAPYGWAFCNGQLISISSNTALFSLLGTAYGGDGIRTFGLPNLQGRAAIDQGQLTGGSSYTMGETAGSDSVTVLTPNMPAHTHPITLALNGNNRGSSASSPQNAYPAPSQNSKNIYNSTTNVSMKSPTVTLAASGGSIPIQISDPSLVMNYSICQYGIFPSRG